MARSGIAAFLLAPQLAFAQVMIGQGPPGLIVGVTGKLNNETAAVLNLRDVEHYIVAGLLRRRVEKVIALSSVANAPRIASDVYALELSIQKAEEAVRPRWKWSEGRFIDDNLLHLEISIIVIRPQDGSTAGGIYNIDEFRADDYGSFSTPEAVRGATYHAIDSIVDEFLIAAARGQFGQKLRTVQRPYTPSDILTDWGRLSGEWKVVTALCATVGFFLITAVVARSLYAIAQLIMWVFTPPDMRTPDVLLPPAPARAQPARRRKRERTRGLQVGTVNFENEPDLEEEESESPDEDSEEEEE